MLITRRLAVIVTLKCTLNCRLCCNCVPLYQKPPILDKEEIMGDIDNVFGLYDKIEWFQFVGGELFLHPDLAEIADHAFRYAGKFDRMILMTNGTLLPDQATLDVFQRHRDRVEVQISDYGSVSKKLPALKKALEERQIGCVVKTFHGDIQHYGGWVDAGDFSAREESDAETLEKFNSCWQIEMENLHLYRGKLHNCIRSLFALDLGMVEIPEDEYVDLRSQSLTPEEKREIAKGFNKKPLTACRYCNGFNTRNSRRYPAAEQMSNPSYRIEHRWKKLYAFVEKE